jgi:hypothetical protein
MSVLILIILTFVCLFVSWLSVILFSSHRGILYVVFFFYKIILSLPNNNNNNV